MSLTQFAKQKLDINCWSKMEEIFSAIERGERKILVRSCNGAGKTTALAAICNWYFSTYDDSIVLTTASSAVQVRRNLWGEIRRQARKAQLYPKKEFTITTMGVHASDKHFMLGISPAIPENAMGFHAPHMLIAVDEATGVDRDIFDALFGNLTGSDAQIVIICNPIATESFAYDAEQSGDWHVIAISAFDHPNVVQGNEDIKGAVSQEWIEDRLRAWSSLVNNDQLADINAEETDRSKYVYLEWSNAYYLKTSIVASRICGEWADYESNGFIPMELIRSRVLKEPPSNPDSIKVMGVDVARSGPDQTVFAFFDGNHQLPFECFVAQDTMRTAALIKQRYDQGWKRIAVDDTGVGAGVTDRLKELGVPVIQINFGQAAVGVFKHSRMLNLANARAEMFFVIEQELRHGEITLTEDAEFHQELAAIRLATRETSDIYRLEEKALTRRRLGRSPDKADAAALARYALRVKGNPVFFM